MLSKYQLKIAYFYNIPIGNDLVAIRKSKLALMLNNPTYIGMCILELSKSLMYEFHYDYIKNKYSNKLGILFTDTDLLMYEITTEDIYKDFNSIKEMFGFSNYLAKSKYSNNSNKLVTGKMKDETCGVAIEELVQLKPKLHSLLIDNSDNSEHKKAKHVNRNVAEKITHNKCKDVSFNNKCMRYSMNRNQNKDHKIGIYKINKVSLSYFNGKIYINEWI